MWKGRFLQQPSQLLQEYTESVSYDWRLYKQDIEGSLAHAEALTVAGILTSEELSLIKKGLFEIREEIDRGTFSFQKHLEDVHMNIEAELTRRIGPTGAKLHTARSRNDQVALDLRLYLREAIVKFSRLVAGLQRSLVGLAFRYPEVCIPGYTHLQRAQPILLAHHLLAYVEMFARDIGRLKDCAARMDELPLGSGAIAGSTIVLDREQMARQLGFSRVTQNSMDAVSDRDFACELLAALAILGMHLSRLSEDIILWVSEEFGFLELSDRHTTGSSLMPQKKNPDIAELTRGKTGRLYGNLFSLLTTLKGLPMTYNRDLQEDKEAVFDSLDTAELAVSVFTEMLEAASVREDRAAEAVSDPLLLATDLADYLVLKGMPFRQAHEVVGRIVAEAERLRILLNQMSLEQLRSISPIFEADVSSVFDLRKAMESRRAPGAPAPSNLEQRLKYWEEILEKDAQAHLH
ncbi:MAG: argininosuccinate lyase [Verrucomicrobia bacterium]|nr:MAG: argininosuccinate lyase [Verrucomicrobiota bacterium]